ncbi:MAG: ATP-binding protein [Acidobacteriota bacterium]
MSLRDELRLPPEKLRWSCDQGCLDFETTAEIDVAADLEGAPSAELVGQDHARDALEFGILSAARGQNVFVRGARGTGRRTMVRKLLETLERDEFERHDLVDHAFVHNFKRPDRPRRLTFDAGGSRRFARLMRDFCEYLETDFPKQLDSDDFVAERRQVEEELQQQLDQLRKPLEDELDAAGFKLTTVQQGPMARTLIFPVVGGKPLPPEQLEQMVEQGQVSRAYLERYEEKIVEYQRRLQDVGVEMQLLQQETMGRMREMVEKAAQQLVSSWLAPHRQQFDETVGAHLDEVVADVVETRLTTPDRLPDAGDRYGVNVVLENESSNAAPVVEEMAPNLSNLLGTVDVTWNESGPASVDFGGIRGGALLAADGGYLILDATDLLAESGAWKALVRTLRSGMLEIVPPEMAFFSPRALVNPEPIPVRVRVILIGDARSYYLLDSYDPDFAELFKVLSDFDQEIERTEGSVRDYASVIAQIARNEELLDFQRCAVGALVEHGARIASREGKLTARFGRLADLAREASFLARRDGSSAVSGDRVRAAVRRTKERASLPSRRFQELIRKGTIRIETTGDVVGQVNGLAVIGAGPITYGFPARITATISAGRAGLIDIEGSASLSGSIHTKGFHILGGLLRHLLKLDHPLAFSASLAFEQSYGGIDGDSASGAETCCLLSALTGVPLSQSIAMTGAIDQHGRIQAIGGVNEKIEGFFDSCDHFGLDGQQGVIIPATNAGDLQLRPDVVEACQRGEFSVWPVETIHQALEIFTGLTAGEWEDGYPEGTILGLAVARAERFWRQSSAAPRPVDDGPEDSAEPPDPSSDD